MDVIETVLIMFGMNTRVVLGGNVLMRKIVKIIVVIMLIVVIPKQVIYANEENARTFDYRAYAETYPDLFAVFGDDYEALYNHYITVGISEGRVGSFYNGILDDRVNRTATRNGKDFYIDGVKVVTSNEPSNEFFNVSMGGYPRVINYSFAENVYPYTSQYYSNDFIDDCFHLFTDEEKVAYINDIFSSDDKLLSIPYAVIDWLTKTQIYTLEQKIVFFKRIDMRHASNSNLAWWWNMIGASLETENMEIADCYNARYYYKSIDNRMIEIHETNDRGSRSFEIPLDSAKRWYQNGWIKKQERTVVFGGVPMDDSYFYVAVQNFTPDCKIWKYKR